MTSTLLNQPPETKPRASAGTLRDLVNCLDVREPAMILNDNATAQG